MLLILFFTAACAYFLGKFILEVRRYPPGPTPFPLLGNLPQLALGLIKYKRILYIHQAWQAKYGPVFTMWMGPIPQVFIGDYDLAVESMVKKGNLFIDRKTFYLFDLLRWGRGIANANGQSWLEQRRFAIHTLKDFGLGKNVMEERVMLELDYRMGLLDKEIATSGGQLVWNPRPFIDLTVANIINRMLFSERFTDEKEVEFFKVKHEMDKMMKDLSLLDVFVQDWNSSWPFLRARYNRMMGLLKPVFDFLTEQVKEKKRQMESRDDVAEDFVETYLLKMRKDTASESFDEENLICTLFDLWLAGQETTALTLNWAFVYFTLHPEITEKLHKELVDVTGNQRKIQLNDRLRTPYLNAVIQEVFRVSSIIPVNLPRIAAEDVMVGGHLIPKGTVCAMLMSIIMADDKNYSNPIEFNPDRFLNGDSDQFIVPFSLGKRACPGEALARAELYLIIGNTVLFYDMKAINGEMPKMEAAQEDGSLREPFPYKMLISHR